MTRRPGALALYALCAGLAEPLAPWLLRARVRRGKEDPGRQGERLGRTDRPRPEGPLMWIHGVSVGESLSHLPLVERMARERPDVVLLVTSGTRTSAELLSRRLPPGVIHQYAPIDAPAAVGRFLDHWRPDLGVFVESELWPNLILSAAARGVRLALIGARISERSARRWTRARSSAAALLETFDLIWTQDAPTRDWVEDLGIEVAGRLDLKRLAAPLPCDEAALAALRDVVQGRPVVVAASTHAGEETLVATAAAGCDPRPLLVVVPRHPERGAEAAQALAAAGWRAGRRSLGATPTSEGDAYVADSLGELGLFYRLGDVVVMGGSLIKGFSGHNPLEAARLGSPVISGPHMDAFAETYADLLAERAVLIAHDGPELGTALSALVKEPSLARALGERGRAFCERAPEGFEDLWASLLQRLPPP